MGLERQLLLHRRFNPNHVPTLACEWWGSDKSKNRYQKQTNKTVPLMHIETGKALHCSNYTFYLYLTSDISLPGKAFQYLKQMTWSLFTYLCQ